MQTSAKTHTEHCFTPKKNAREIWSVFDKVRF